MNKKYILYAILPAVILASVGAAAVYANSKEEKVNPMSALVTKIADKFGLSESDVQAVFDDYSSEMKIDQEAKMEEMKTEQETKVKEELAALVEDGTLTQDQVDAILDKREELQSERSTMEKPSEEKSDEDREAQKEEMQAKQDELKQWAEDNNISEEYLKYVQGFGGGFGGPMGGHGPDGMRGPGGHGPDDKASSDSEE